MREFLFVIGELVEINVSGEEGEVIGRAEYANQKEGMYLVRYKAADGRAVEVWWTESALGRAK